MLDELDTPLWEKTLIDRYIETAMAKQHIPGLAVAVTRHSKPVLVKGYGMANVELSVPVTENTVFEIASVTKTFTATAVMILVEEGKASLHSEIGEYLPDLPITWRDVTLQHLLTHTSGIKNYTDVADYWKTTRLDISREEILNLVAGLPLDFPPGQSWAYSNTGYYLLGLVIEKLSGQTYGDFLDDRMFKPLEMASTQVNEPVTIVRNRAAGYTWKNGSLCNKEYYSPSGTYAAGVLLSSASDMAKWDAALYTSTVVKQSTLQQMWAPDRAVTETERQYGFVMGLGWFLFDHHGHKVMGHNGGIKEFSSTMSRFTDDHVTVTMMWNLDNFERPDALAHEVAAFFIPELTQE